MKKIRNHKPHILIITPYLPYPLTSGGAVRVYNLLKQLSNKYAFHLLCFIYSEDERKYIPDLQDFCETIDVVLKKEPPELSRWRSYLRYIGMLSTPDFIVHMRSEEMERKIAEMLQEYPIDIIQIEFTQMAQYLPINSKTPSILVELDIFFETLRKRLRIPMKWRKKMLAFLEWAKMRQYELAVLPRFTKIVTMSDHDRELLRARNSKLDTVTIPNGVDCSFFNYNFNPSIEGSVLFVGNFMHSPNVDGVLYFAREIWPGIKDVIPDAKFTVVGNAPTDEIKSLASDDVVIKGGVPDLRPYYAESAVCVIPLRIGSGTRLKLLEALACGVPVVTTPVGAEGLNLENGNHCLIADSAAEFASGMIKLLENRELRMKLSQNGRRLVESKYDWDIIAVQQDELYPLLLGERA